MTVRGVDRVTIIGIDKFRAWIEVDAEAKAGKSIHEIVGLGNAAGIDGEGVEVERGVLIVDSVQGGGIGAPLKRVEQVPRPTEAWDSCGPWSRVIKDGNAALRRGAETHVGEGDSGCAGGCRCDLDVQREVVAEGGIGTERVADV